METKSNAETLFAGFGITLSDAINIFLHKAVMEGGLPFEMRYPRYNMETEIFSLIGYWYIQKIKINCY